MPKKSGWEGPASVISNQIMNGGPKKIPLPQVNKLETPQVPAMSPAMLERISKK